MLESLTATAFIGTGTATALPTANASIGTVQKIDAKRGAPTTMAKTTKNQLIVASLTASVSTASTMAGDKIKYSQTLTDAYACVESMSDEQLEQALIKLGELEGNFEEQQENAKQYVK